MESDRIITISLSTYKKQKTKKQLLPFKSELLALISIICSTFIVLRFPLTYVLCFAVAFLLSLLFVCLFVGAVVVGAVVVGAVVVVVVVFCLLFACVCLFVLLVYMTVCLIFSSWIFKSSPKKL